MAEFGREVNRIVPADRTLYLFRTEEDRTSYYLRPKLQQATELPAERPIFLVTEVQHAQSLIEQGGTILLEARPYTRRGDTDERRVLIRLN